MTWPGWSAEFRDRAARTLEHLKDNLPRLPDEAVEEAGLVLRRRRELLGRLQQLAPAWEGNASGFTATTTSAKCSGSGTTTSSSTSRASRRAR